MSISDSASRHSVLEEEHESKCINFLKCLISEECGNIISLINAVLSVACVIIYIFTNYEPNFVLTHSSYFFITNFSCRCFFTLILIFEIILGKYNFTSFSQMTTLILEILSTVPYLLSRISIGMTEDLISQTHLSTLKKYFHTDVNRELYSIISFLICLIFDFTIIVNVIENTQTVGKYYLFLPRDCINVYFCEGNNDTLHSTLFFIMTTIGIVGYNSNILSNLGRIIICGIIILGIYEIPSQFSNNFAKIGALFFFGSLLSPFIVSYTFLYIKNFVKFKNSPLIK